MQAKAPRQASKERTRKALIDAALALFTEQGLDAPSLDAICARAGCTRGAFYVHFVDRDALIAATMEQRRGDVLASLLGSSDVGVAEVLDVFSHAVAAGAFPVPGAVRTGELVGACRRSAAIRRTHLGLLARTLERLTERVTLDQKRARMRADVEPGGVALMLLLFEAGAELLLDLGFSPDLAAGTGALKTLLAAHAPRG
jgi:TetR/AcrR family transcriptional repressor of nem operon